MSYEVSIGYLEGLYHEPILPAAQVGLTRARRLLAELDNPHHAFRSIHVAGTCGKGSTTTMIGSILAAAGKHTGLFRSPHLRNYTERVTVADRDIGRDAWARHLDRIRPIVDAMRDGSLPDYSLGRPSLFEVLFALGALHFVEQQVEWAVVETGLGGRLDATNTLQPAVAVITNVSLEHTQVLGRTVEAIAGEKAGIVKSATPVVLGTDDDRVRRVVVDRARDLNAPVVAGRSLPKLDVLTEDLGGQVLCAESRLGTVETRLPLPGPFQIANARTAVGAIEVLAEHDPELTAEAIRRGLSAVSVPGRMEIHPGNPTVIFDGAHNPAAAAELARAVEHLHAGRALVVFATMADKDVRAMIKHLRPVATEFFVTRAPGTERAADPSAVARSCAELGVKATVVEDAPAALEMSTLRAGSGGTVLVTGSLYLVGALRPTEQAAVRS